MSDAYREAAGKCPDCSAPLREHANRMVCDQCNGMMLTMTDYQTSLLDLDGSNATLAVSSSKPATAKCPRCTHAMTEVELTLGGKKLTGRYLHCEKDGAWVPNQSMVAAFAVVSHRARRAAVSGGLADVIPRGPGGHGGAVAIAAVADAFRNRPGFVSIGSVMAHKHTAFVSAFSGQDLMCPKCNAALAFQADRWACKSCAGSFVEDAALVAMVQDITNAYWEMPAIGSSTGSRACPACKQAMVVEKYNGIEIDRCKPHGVWFDADELQTVLVEQTNPKETGGWLSKLFGRAKPSARA